MKEKCQKESQGDSINQSSNLNPTSAEQRANNIIIKINLKENKICRGPALGLKNELKIKSKNYLSTNEAQIREKLNKNLTSIF